MKSTDIVDNQNMRDDIPTFFPGDEVKVHVRVVESGKERIQIFQGNIMAILYWSPVMICTIVLDDTPSSIFDDTTITT